MPELTTTAHVETNDPHISIGVSKGGWGAVVKGNAGHVLVLAVLGVFAWLMTSDRAAEQKARERAWQTVGQLRDTLHEMQLTQARIETTLRIPPADRERLLPPVPAAPPKPTEGP